MSCLALSELSLSDQAAVQQSFAAAIEAKYAPLINLLDSPADSAGLPLGGRHAAGGSTPLPVATYEHCCSVAGLFQPPRECAA